MFDLEVIEYKPPHAPWMPLVKLDDRAIITYYYGDSKSEEVPIRDVSNKRDPKVEPNYETLTYGLFSTCNPSARKSIVTNGITTNFFCTLREDIRVLTGYYKYGWYFEYKKEDYMLAANKVRFVSPGFPLKDIIYYADNKSIGNWFRCWKYVNQDTAKKLLQLLNDTPDKTSSYIEETKKVEKNTLIENGIIYNKRKKGYSWKDAKKFLLK